MNYHKLLLDELRFVVYEKGDASLTEELLIKAVTLNENLKSLGYVLSPTDIAALAVSPSLDGFYESVKSMMGRVDAAPMYPGFPRQVMEIDEAVFRFHQAVHYFSTYGMELLFGVEVHRGWLPCEGARGEVAKQDTVLPEKVIRLLPAQEAYIVPLRMILSRRERMTLPERQIVSEAIAHISVEEADSLDVRFKENMNAVYAIVFDMADRDAAFRILRSLSRHTGDVLRCIDVLLGKHKFHFRTTQKRFLVKLLESYSEKDFRANLVLSGKNARRNILLLNYIDYSVYSRSSAHMDAVNELRDGKLRSWESIAKKMLTAGSDGALSFISQRPGMMLRMVAWLLRIGYDKDAIVAELSEKADSLSMQTLVTNLNYFGKLTEEERSDATALVSVFEEVLKAHMAGRDTVLRNKKVALAMPEFDLPKGQSDGEDYELFKEANCFFSHHLRQDCTTVNYGYIDVPNRCIVFDGAPQEWHYDWYAGVDHRQGAFSLGRYLERLLEAQHVSLCDAEEADVVLVMGKDRSEKEMSLVDANFFMDAA